MKKTAKAQLAVAVTASVIMSAAMLEASPVVYEPFSYPAGELHGQSGASEVGLTGTWDAKVEAEHSTVVTNESLYGAYASLGGKIGPLSGGVNKYGGSRAINPAALAGNGLLDDGATLWMSVVMGYGAGGNLTNSRLAVALANDTFNSGNYNYWIEDYVTQAGEGVGVVLGRFSLNGRTMPVQFQNLAAGDGVAGNIVGAWTGAGTALGENQNAIYAVKFTWGANSSQPDTMEVYQPNGNLSLGSPISTLSNIFVNQAAFDTLTFARSDVMALDEIRFGATYADVTPPNVSGPSLVTKSPLGSSGLLPLKATFDRNILRGQGSIRIYNSNGALHSTLAATDASRVSISGNEMTLTPPSAFTVGQSYYIEMDAGVVRDVANNHFAGFVGSSAWNFAMGSLTDPESDADDDGLTNAVEVTLGSEPLIADTDGDGLGDGFEFNSGGAHNLLVADFVAPPTFTPVAGTSLTKFPVVLSCASSGAVIHYTVTGADPTIHDPSVVSGGAVMVAKNTILKAKAFIGADSGEISSTTFVLTGDVSAGGQSMLALVTNGQVYGWGNQASGRLSNGVTAAGNVLVPELAKYSATTSVTNVRSISSGTSHGLVLDESGSVWGFGTNSFGESGNSSTATTIPYALPVASNPDLTEYLTGCTKVVAGLEFSAALESGGFVQTWGNQRHGRLGNGTNVVGSRKFAGRVKVSPSADLSGIRDVALGKDFALAREACSLETAGSLGRVWVWGNNGSGNLGIGNTIARSYAVKAKLNSTMEFGDAWDVDAGDNFAAIVRWKTGDPDLQGSVWTFGNRASGRLGDNGAITGISTYPVQVQKFDGTSYSQLNGITQISAGASHTLAVDDAGNVWAWGSNVSGALGDNTTVDKNHAVKVLNPEGTDDLSNIVRVSAGGGAGSAAFSTAIAEDGTIYVWGSNEAGQLANGTASSPVFAKLPVIVSQLQTIPGFPTVSLNAAVTAPVAPGSATLTATVGDPQGDATIQKTEFYVRGVLQSTRTEPPWTASLTSLQEGTYTAYAKTMDVDGNESTSLPTGFTIESDDTDADGMLDSWEMAHFGNLNQSGAGDFDGDGISNSTEFANGTDPTDYYNGTVPVLAVASGDKQAIAPSTVTPQAVVFSVKNGNGVGMASAPVAIAITSPTSDYGALDPLSSGEFTVTTITGVTDASGQISVYFKSPATFSENATIALDLANSPVLATVSATVQAALIDADSDDDGMPDDWEIIHFGDLTQNADGDPDGDGLTNLAEFQQVTNPLNPDSDDDGMPDGWEFAHELNPTDSTGINGASGDLDNDGYGNLAEYHFGSDPNDMAAVPSGDIAAGANHSVALTGEGRVWSWGDNTYGQVGDGNTGHRYSPVPVVGVAGMSRVIGVGAGKDFSMALDDQGNLWGWGSNTGHQISVDETSHYRFPVRIALPGKIHRFCCGEDHALALGRDGRIWAWGGNSYGQLGQGHENQVRAFVEVQRPPGMMWATSLAAGSYSSHVLDVAGNIWAWGNNDYGGLGDGSTVDRSSPVKADFSNGVPKVTDIRARGFHAMALGVDGSFWSWGFNNYGQLGLGGAGFPSKPTKVTGGLPDIKALGTGLRHAVAITTGGNPWSWGNNQLGQLGTGGTVSSNVPGQTAAVTGFSDIVRIACGDYHSIGLKPDGQLWTWGYNYYGQLGHGDTAQRTTAAPLAGLKLRDDDTDYDGLPDSWEKFHYSGSLSGSGTDTGVSGGVENEVAYAKNLNPLLTDNDGDGLTDVMEIAMGLDPLDWSDATGDLDGDRIPNLWEEEMGSDMIDSGSFPATTSSVGSGQTIQAAINAVPANTSNPTWAIIRVASGVYPERITLPAGKRILLIPDGSGIPEIRGNSTGNTVRIDGTSVVDGFRITHMATISGDGVSTSLSAASAPARLANCMIYGNQGSSGAGINAAGGKTVVAHCTVYGNTSSSTANGITVASQARVLLIHSILWNPHGQNPNETSGIGVMESRHSIVKNGTLGTVLLSDPLLAPDGALTLYSPARSYGESGMIAVMDIDGEMRGTPPDIGADQFVDTDLDLLADTWEFSNFGDLSKSGTDDDDVPMPDRLTNMYEHIFGFDPKNPDTVGNGLGDLYNAVFSPTDSPRYPSEWLLDSDDDGLTDGQEIYFRTDPNNSDTNGDGVPDLIAIQLGIDPFGLDTDGDTFTNAQEIALGTNPFVWDTDGDGVSDHLDAFPLDSTRSELPITDPGDNTAPIITLLEPLEAVPIP